MSEDYNRNNPSLDLVQQMVLIDIRTMLQSTGKDIRSFPLLDIDHTYDNARHIPREIFEEASVKLNPKDVLLCDSLNTEQRSAYDEIMAAVCSKQGGLFFVDGPSGTGKTHYNTMYLCRHITSRQKFPRQFRNSRAISCR